MAAVDLVVSDVDGTLVTPDKQLTEASRRAVARLAEAGIGFTITSSRPPFGLKMLVAPLALSMAHQILATVLLGASVWLTWRARRL